VAGDTVSDQLVTNQQASAAWEPAVDVQPALEGPLADQTLPLPAARPGPSVGAAVRQLQPRRFGVFGGIGALVFVLGTALQWLLIAVGDGKTASYLWQAVFSIELSFALNRWLTWRDRHVDLASALFKWNIQKLALTVPNVAIYAVLVRLGMNWLLANVLLTAVLTLVNYVGANLWSFRAMHLARHRAAGGQAVADSADAGITHDNHVLPAGMLPEVSVVIPCKNSQRTIRATVQSLLSQDYPALVEVIIVGDVGDQTWHALEGVTDPRLVIVEHEEIPGKREPAIKRDVGARKARGEILALADSDIIMDRNWLSHGVSLLLAQRGGVVCGGMRSAEDSFWGRFVDSNAIAAKTPRVPRSYKVTARNFGRHGRKPPITANAIMTREVYDDCPMDDAWGFGYEDYEWFWRIARAGHQVLYAAGLTGAHHHRRSFRALAREYKISAHGCAHFLRAYPDCPLSRKRKRQARMLPLAALCAVGGAAGAAVEGYGPMVAGAAAVSVAWLIAREVVRTRRLEALAYPFVGLALGVLFTIGLGWRLAIPGSTRLREAEDLADLEPVAASASPVTRLDLARLAPVALPASPVTRLDLAGPSLEGPATEGSGPEVLREAPEPLTRRVVLALAFLVVLGAGAGVRFWQLATKPDLQSDETVYSTIARNLLLHSTLNEHLSYGAHWVPFLYQPPLYMLGLARWFALVGPSIYHARILGVVCSLITLTLMWRLIWRQHGARAALYASVPIVFDGWLLFVQRVSYIENVTLLFVVAAMLLYQRALDRPAWPRFAIAGLALGLAVCVKFTGLYVMPAVVLCWLILRREHRGHVVLLGTALAVFAAEQVALIRLFDLPGHKWYLDQTLVQVERVSGMSQSGGTLSSPTELLHLLFAQYKMFIPSLLIVIATLVVIIRKLLYCYRERTVASLRPQALLFSWAVAGIVVFGFSSLRYPQYFALVLLPVYCLWWTEAWHWKRGATLKVALATLAVVAGLGSFWLRVGSQSDDVFAETQQYAAAHIPATAVVLADETIGDLIGQPYCPEQAATPCLWRASYAITWTTYLQSTVKLGDPAFNLMMQGATRVWSRTGFNGTITVWRLH
jgi:4-amino-4-deoxy-L-arabinose transferase-like glycosyltransferase/putative flippase GtrA